MLENTGLPLNKPFTFDQNPVHFVNWLKRK